MEEEIKSCGCNRRLKRIKEKSAELIQDSTWHGLPNVISKEGVFAKIFWLVTFATSFGLCLFLITSSLVSYFEYKVLVKHNLVSEMSFDFPAVTFCNLNPVDYKNNPGLVDEMKRIYLARLNNETRSQINIDDAICDRTTKLLGDALLQLNYTPHSAFFTIDQMLLKCTFNEKPCRKEDFVLYKSYIYGNCYIWNSGFDSQMNKLPIKAAVTQGISSGLRLELFVGEQQHLPCWIDTTGAILVVHNKSVDPLVSVDGVKMKTGQESNLAVSRLFVKKLPSPYSNCIMNTESIDAFESYWYKKTFDFTRTYQRNYCVNFCAGFASLEANATSCFNLLNYYTLAGLRECLLSAYDRDFFYNNCFPQCPSECFSSILSFSQNFADYPTNLSVSAMLKSFNFSQFFSSTPSFEQMKRSTLAINVYYDSSFYTIIEDEPQTNFETLIANIGGNMALFLGLSVLSLLELVEFVVSILYIFLPKSKIHHINVTRDKQ